MCDSLWKGTQLLLTPFVYTGLEVHPMEGHRTKTSAWTMGLSSPVAMFRSPESSRVRTTSRHLTSPHLTLATELLVNNHTYLSMAIVPWQVTTAVVAPTPHQRIERHVRAIEPKPTRVYWLVHGSKATGMISLVHLLCTINVFQPG